jgi:hypothetical protein
MNMQQHQICLESKQHFAGRLPTHHLGFLLTDLPICIRGAISMALRNRSKAPGKQPKWLRRSNDLRFTGHVGNGVSHLKFELPALLPKSVVRDYVRTSLTIMTETNHRHSAARMKCCDLVDVND